VIRSIIFVLFYLSCFNSNAQAPPYFIIGAEEFSNVDVYSLLYDDTTDLIYAATNRGLFVYRQNKFTVLPSNPKQIGASFFQLKKDNIGRLFCCNTVGQVFLVKKNRLELFYQVPKLINGYGFRYFFDRKNNLIISTSLVIKKINPSGIESVIFSADKAAKYFPEWPKRESILNITQMVNGDVYFGPEDNSSYLVYSNKGLSFRILFKQDEVKRSPFFEFDERIFFSSNGKMQCISDTNFSAPISIDPFSSSYQLGANSFSILNDSKGLRILELENDSLIETSFGFENSFLSAITQNNNKTIFLGTFKEGVIVIPNSQTKRYLNEYPFTGITVSKHNIVCLSNQKQVLITHYGDSLERQQYNSSLDYPFYLNGTYSVEGKPMHGIVYDQLYSAERHLNWSNNIKDLKEFDEEMAIYISTGIAGFFLEDHSTKLHPEFANEEFPGYYTFKLEDRGRSITYIENDEKIYYATNTNLYSKKWNTGEKNKLNYKGNNIHANYLSQLDGKLLIGTRKKGVLFFENEVFKSQLSVKDGLKSNTILKIKTYKNFIVILSIHGIQIYDQSTSRFVHLGEAEGVLSSKVIDFAISEDQLWLLEKHGYYSVPLNKFSSTNTLAELGSVELESMLVNDKKVSMTSHIEFTYDQNNIQFFFDYRDIETKNESKFLYKLVGAQEEWNVLESSVNSIEFPSLAPGRYTLLLKVRYRGEETERIEYSFTILPPFWLRAWFILLCGLIVVSLVSLFFLRRFRKNRKERRIELEKQKMQTDIFESKLKAIRSQMNPHFIFNSLNSIQALVLEQDAKKSYDYIEKIATLVRKTLQFSEKNFVQLSDEIEFLTIYADLESLRMKEQFQFSIVNNVEDEIQIPALLIQPFIENAIHHGLLHKEGEKRLRIEFNREDGCTSCTISDNGIGRQLSKEIKSRQNSHESFSLNAIKERLQILSEQNDKHFKYDIKDLYDKDRGSAGTEVKVYYPHLNNY
jgi:hypothetical protein